MTLHYMGRKTALATSPDCALRPCGKINATGAGAAFDDPVRDELAAQTAQPRSTGPPAPNQSLNPPP
jgi:hypothetical protein